MAFLGPVLTLAVTDNLDQTATPVASGVAAGALVLFYRGAWTGRADVVAWTQVATAVANGSGVATPAPVSGSGFFVWQAISGPTGQNADAVSNLAYKPVAAPATVSVWEQCANAVQVTIRSLALDGLPDDKVVVQWYPKIERDVQPAPPCCLVAPFGSEQYSAGYFNSTDEVVYPVIVVLIDKLNSDSRLNITRDLLWRQRIQRAFRRQRLAGVASVGYTEPQPDAVVNPDAYNANLLVSATVFKFTSYREPRGLS